MRRGSSAALPPPCEGEPAIEEARGARMKAVAPHLADRLALTVPEAASAVGVSERHLRSMLPEIPHVHLGGRVVIPVDALRGWLLDRTKAERGRAEKVAEEVLRAVREA